MTNLNQKEAAIGDLEVQARAFEEISKLSRQGPKWYLELWKKFGMESEELKDKYR